MFIQANFEKIVAKLESMRNVLNIKKHSGYRIHQFQAAF